MFWRRSLVGSALAGVLIGLGLAGPAGALEVGQKAPAFTLAAPGGKQLTLEDLTSKGPVVLYTFIQAFGGVWTNEIKGFEANLSQFEALHAQVVGVSADVANTLEAFTRDNHITHPLLSDFGRKMLPAYDALVTDEQSPVYRYGKRAYFIIDRQGIVRYKKIMDNPLDLLKPEEVLQALKESGA